MSVSGYNGYAPPPAPQNLPPSQSGGMMEQSQSALNPTSFTPPYQGNTSAMGMQNQQAGYLSSQGSQQTQYPATSSR